MWSMKKHVKFTTPLEISQWRWKCHAMWRNIPMLTRFMRVSMSAATQSPLIKFTNLYANLNMSLITIEKCNIPKDLNTTPLYMKKSLCLLLDRLNIQNTIKLLNNQFLVSLSQKISTQTVQIINVSHKILLMKGEMKSLKKLKSVILLRDVLSTQRDNWRLLPRKRPCSIPSTRTLTESLRDHAMLPSGLKLFALIRSQTKWENSKTLLRSKNNRSIKRRLLESSYKKKLSENK